MKRSGFLVLIIMIAVAAAATGAVVTAVSVPVQQVTPRIHHDREGGYFLIDQPLPGDVRPASISVKVDTGEVWLVTAQIQSTRETVQDDETEDELVAQSAKAKTEPGHVAIAGRFASAGKVRLTLLAASGTSSAKPVATLEFSLSEGMQERPEVRSTWARHQQRALMSADPTGADPYTHYWDLAIAPRYGLSPALGNAWSRFRREPPDLYSVFTGAAAIQETLQLELLGSDQRTARPGGETTGTVPVTLSSLQGPSTKSHPFREMLKGRVPQLPPLAAHIPEDQYAVYFGNINKQIELADLMDEWGGNLLHQSQAEARDFKVRGKISRQLCLENSWLTRMFGDRVIADMAFTGQDPFLKEGTAFTVLFSLKDRDTFRKQIEKNHAEAARQPGVSRSEFSLGGFRGVSAVSSDRSISSHALFIGDYAVVSNSRVSLQRIVDVDAGRLPAMAQADDFRYMRTIFPQNAAEEDIFVYFSDAHIRSLVGPRWKIGEARRMRCSGTMTLLANARLWFKAEQRREPTFKELASGGYLGASVPECPDHGAYEFGKDGQPRCTLHNSPGVLTPVGEVPLTQVTPQEAAQYRAFVENYNRYWTQFFDPIGIRIKMGKDVRIQTCILPLIENSWYDGLAAFSGKTPGELTESALLSRTIISVRGHMSKKWLENLRLPHGRQGSDLGLSWLGNEIALNLCDGQILFSTGGQAMGLMGRDLGRSSLEPLIIGYLGSAMNLPTYLTVKVTDPAAAERAIPGLFQSLGPRYRSSDDFSVETYSIEQHNGKPLYVATFNLWIIKLRIFSAVVDDRLVIASRKDIVTDLLDGTARGAAAVPKHEGNMELSVYRSAFKQLEDAVNLGWQEDLRHSCHKNLPLAAILMKNLGLPQGSLASAVESLRGYQPYCPSGGRYSLDAGGSAVSCSIHGNLRAPKQPPAGDASSKTLDFVNTLQRVNARLTFTPEGLMTTVDIKRK